jgi:lysophospholipase L1-like esterase
MDARWLGAIVVVLAVVWFFWPSPYSRVRNLDSRGTTIIAFGDSLTAGYGAQPGEDYPSQLSQILGTPIMNRGVSGDTTEAARLRLEQDVLTQKPRIVIVGLGGNDFLRGEPLSTTETNLREIVRAIQGSGAMVVLLGFRFPSLNADYDGMYERVAKENRCLFIPGVLSGILTDMKLKSDAIHPNAAGYRLMASRIAEPVRKLLKASAK